MNRALLLLAILLAWTLPSAQAQGQDNKASSKLYAREKGDEVEIAIQVRLDPGFHLYHGPTQADTGDEGAGGLPTVVEFEAEGFTIGPVVYPTPEREKVKIADDVFTSLEHKGTFVLHARGKRTKPDAKIADIRATITGLTCDAKGCTRYEEELSSQGAGADALFANMPASAPASAPQDGARPAPAPAPQVAAKPAPAPPPQDGANPAAPPAAKANAQKVSSKLFARANGDDVEIAIEVKVEPGYHVYHGPAKTDTGDEGAGGKPTVVEIDAEGFEIGALVYPAPEKVAVKIGEETFTSNEHLGTFVLHAKGKRTQASAKLEEITARITGYVCDAKACTDYAEDLAFAGPGTDAAFAAPVAQPARAADPSTPASSGLWIFLLSAVGWGLFTLLMPCTYPMIPITISYFTKQASQRQGSTLPLSLAYGIGIVATFVLIGIVIGPPIVIFASHPLTNLVIGLMFIFFALALFGAVNLQPPAFLLNLAGQASAKGGLGGVFLMGALLVVTSFTCTAPFVGTLLSAGASSGAGVGRVALGMAVFGLTMAVPFVGLSMIPGKVKAIPRSGEWMHTLKVTLGFVEIAAALKFISNVDIVWEWHWLSRELFLALWVAIFVATALYLFGMIRLKDEGTTEVSPARMLAGLFFLTLSLYCGYGALGNRLDSIMTAIVPPYSNSLSVLQGGKSRNQESWPIVIDDYEVALAQAQAEGKLLLVNFTGHT
jgi:thiol:disulfide interchange protein